MDHRQPPVLGRFVRQPPPQLLRLAAQHQMRLGWLPTHPGLIADIEEGHYFKQ
jgi:hypothetical protein